MPGKPGGRLDSGHERDAPGAGRLRSRIGKTGMGPVDAEAHDAGGRAVAEPAVEGRFGGAGAGERSPRSIMSFNWASNRDRRRPRRRWVGRVATQVTPPAGRAVRPGSVSSRERTASEPTILPSSKAQSARSNGKAQAVERALVLLRSSPRRRRCSPARRPHGTLPPGGRVSPQWFMHPLPQQAAVRLQVRLPVGLAGLAALAQQLAPTLRPPTARCCSSVLVARLEQVGEAALTLEPGHQRQLVMRPVGQAVLPSSYSNSGQ